jgi:hypothetical protein
MTSTSFGWVLLDGQGPDAATLDHDTFDIQTGDDGASRDTSQHAAAVRGAQAIATASGHQVGTVHVTWTDEVEANAAALMKSLCDLGFHNVHPVSLPNAAQAWGTELGRQSEHTSTGLCILEPDAATIMVVPTEAGTVRTAITDTRETTEDLVESLRTVFRKDGWLPESLYLVGAHADLDDVARPILEALPIPVSDSVDTQLALARGAALTTVSEVDADSPRTEPTPEPPWRVSIAKESTTSAPETVVAPAVSPVDTDSTQAIETSHTEPPRSGQRSLVLDAKKLSLIAAAVAGLGAALSLTAGSALNIENTSMRAAAPAASGASVTSASVHPVPAPTPTPQAPPVQPLAAEPPPPPPLPPETLVPPAQPLAVAVPEPAPAVVPQQTVTVPTAAPVVAPVVAPAPAEHLVAPVAPPTAAPVVVPAAPPPAAPVVAPVAPPPVVAPVAPPPVVAPVAPLPAEALVAPVAPPPAAPVVMPPAAGPAPGPPQAPVAAPPAAPPVPPQPTEPPPQDPMTVVSNLLFGSLP